MTSLRTTVKQLLCSGLVPGDPEANPKVPAEVLEPVHQMMVFDLEMSGSNPRVHELLEIGAIIADLSEGFPERESFGTRVRPRRIGNANPSALRVVGYSPAGWRNAPRVEEGFERLLALGRGALATGWGVGQDVAFLQEQLRRMGKAWPFQPYVLDVQLLARQILNPEEGVIDRFNLGHVADRLGIGRMGEHSALADAYATYDVLLNLMRQVEDPGTLGPEVGGLTASENG